MPTIYRVEDPTLTGPYSVGYGSATLRMRDDHNQYGLQLQLHPSPYMSWQVSISRLPWNTKCAFKDMRSLFAWFGGWLPGMLREGFHITVIDDADVTHGPDIQGQVLFIDNRKTKGQK